MMDLTSIFLVVVFYTNEGQPVLMDGWYPREVETREQCEEVGAKMLDYIKTNLEPPPGISNVDTVCKSGVELMGYQEV